MGQSSVNDRETKVEGLVLRVSELEAELEYWRNKALLFEMKMNALEDRVAALHHKLAQSLPLYDPDEYVETQ
jgi:hypothetical protein